ncbi:hypothetical protein X989_5891 [Burkholderia pseudomallei MSHR4378]|nr:hypothetical protein X989_5891 [Burkholderia pseudomallei MSHR4378]
MIDHQPVLRIGVGATLATSALFSCAGLVIDQDCGARNFAQCTLHGVELSAMMDWNVPPQLDFCVVFRVVGHDHHSARTFGEHLLHDLRNGNRAVDRLAPGHRDGIVEQDLVGDVDARGNRLPNGQIAGVKIGPLAHVLENVGIADERRSTEPVNTFPAHLGQPLGLAVHPGRHVVAPDASERAAAFRYAGRGVMRTTGAEIWQSPGSIGRVGQQGWSCEQRSVDVQPAPQSHFNPIDNGPRQHGGAQLTNPRNKRRPGHVMSAAYRRTTVVRKVEQHLLYLLFNHADFLLDHEDMRQARGERHQPFSVKRIGQSGPVDANVGMEIDVPLCRADPFQHFHDIVMGLPDGHYPDRRSRRRHDESVNAVATGKRRYRLELASKSFLDSTGQKIAGAEMGLISVDFIPCHVRKDRPRPDLDGAAALHRLRDRLERDPRPRATREFPSPQAKLLVFLYRRRMHNRNTPTHQRVVAGIRYR